MANERFPTVTRRDGRTSRQPEVDVYEVAIVSTVERKNIKIISRSTSDGCDNRLTVESAQRLLMNATSQSRADLLLRLDSE